MVSTPAIARHGVRASFDSEDMCADALCYRLFAEAERVRWRTSDIPWQAIERNQVSPALVAFVREIAFSELTTHSATRRFLQDFGDDVDLTQWIAVWFYEESTHSHVLMQWLHQFGERCSAEAVRRGRQSTPFMRSRFGTLVTNVISETVASQNYLALQRGSSEPVLSLIARHLAADEARHASGFMAYARRMLEQSAHPELDRMDALKVLLLWFEGAGRVTHPVSEFRKRSGVAEEAGQLPPGVPELLQADAALVERHACRAVGSLIGLRLDTLASAAARLTELRAQLETDGGRHAAS